MLRSLEFSQTTFDRWRNQYGGMKAKEAGRLKEIVADLTLDNRMLKQVTEAGQPFAEAHGGLGSRS